MLNARLNLLRPLFSDADYPAIRYAVSFHDKTYDWVLSQDVAAQLYEYIRRHWHLATDDEADDPLDDLRRSGARQDSCRLNHAAICCLFPMATTASRSGLRVTTVIGDQSRVGPVQRAG